MNEAAVDRPVAPPLIDDYAIIGDCRSAALISREGSIDWLCWPRFDSPAIFAGLLDPVRGGTFRLRPLGTFSTTRRYKDDTAVLQTSFHSESGDFVLTDAMPIAGAAEHQNRLMPEHEIVRILECTRGQADIEVWFAPRTGFAQWNDRMSEHRHLGIRIETRQGLLTLRTDRPLEIAHDRLSASGTHHLLAGEALHVSLTWTADAPAVLPPLGEWTRQVVARTEKLWQQWSARTRFSGRYRDLVVRSAITVRLLTYAPSGAVIAAATTSLPEKLGGKNNWDYRYCWLRDAAFTVRGMLGLGHVDEATGFASWMLHATRLTQPKLLVLYDVFGRKPQKETTVAGLSGYRNSAPVQIGNGADDQLQLDSYGEVIDAVWRMTRAGMPLDRITCGVLEGFGLYVCEHWNQPDAGIWEPRGEPAQHVHSQVLCWVALDRLIDLQDKGDMRSRHRKRFADTRDEIRVQVERRGYNQALESYTATLDGQKLDATALLLGWYGYAAPDSPRMQNTYKRVVEQLSPKPGLLFRYLSDDDDGAFGICSFWLSEHLARGGGTLEQARAAFEATIAYANDVGLFAEEIEPETGCAVGNVPQTFTHVGLINAALSLVERAEKEGVAP